jgi:CubicO group peptidase (beta-lactamase class C family)
MKKLFFISLLSLCEGLMLLGQSEPPAFVRDSIDQYIEQALQSWKIPGVAVAIVKDGKVVVAKGYGRQSMARDDLVDENTLFMIGSNTKAFTGTLLAWMEYEKKCSLDDKVVKWLPEFKMKDPWVASELNLTDIVSHRIGMETFQGDFMYWNSALTKDEVITKFGMLTPQYGFRTQWGYTNAGFLLAGECIGAISGESWESNLRERIFEPLEMDHTLALSAEIPAAKNIAFPHTLVFDTLKSLPFPLIDNLAPAGSISSSVSDMSHWLICLLDSGRYKGNEIIPFPVIRETRKPRSIIGNSHMPFNRTHYLLYGMGWELMDYENHEIVMHTGGVDGFVTSVTLVPEENLGIVVLTNTDLNYFFEALKWEIVDAYLGLPYRDYTGLFFNSERQYQEGQRSVYLARLDTVAMHNKPATDLVNFAGHYIHPVYGYLDIAVEGDHLLLSLEHHPGMTGRLECMGGNRFLCTYSNPTYGVKVIPFIVENKKVKSIQLTVADFVDFSVYEFVKQ